MTATDLVAIVGLVTGVAGSVLGVLSYLRDRARVEVGLQWDLNVVGDARYDENKKWGLITVTNVGRRPVYVSHVALRLPDNRFGITHMVIREGIAGRTLAEGSPAATYVVDQADMERYASVWHLIRAQVSDSTGREWLSNWVRPPKPSWAEPQPARRARREIDLGR